MRITDLFNIPEQCIFDINIPKDKIFNSAQNNFAEKVENVVLHACLKPSLTNVVASSDENRVYDEIHMYIVNINTAVNLFDTAKEIYRTVKYPSIIMFEFKNKYIISLCPFSIGKNDEGKNILGKIVFSHWIYPNQLSNKSSTVIDDINSIFKNQHDLCQIYKSVYNRILTFRIGGISKTQVSALLYDMTGKKSISHLLDNCTPYQKYFVTQNSKRAVYDKSYRSDNYKLIYDTEDLWYSFQNREETKAVIDGRKYKDIDDLIFSINQKYNTGE